jgi:hypothetical protein
MILLFTLALNWANLNEAFGQSVEKYKVKLRMFSQEVAIVDPVIAAEIYWELIPKEEEADLVHNLHFKYDKYIFCQRDPLKMHICAVYLNQHANGELSSYHTDTDYGKGDVIEAAYTKPVTGYGYFRPIEEGLILTFEGDLAKSLYDKMYKAKEDVEEPTQFWIKTIRQGQHMGCQRKDYLESDYTSYACAMTVRMNKEFEPPKDWSYILY